MHGALWYLSPPPFCANQKYPCKGRHRNIRQSANLGTNNGNDLLNMQWDRDQNGLDPKTGGRPLAALRDPDGVVVVIYEVMLSNNFTTARPQETPRRFCFFYLLGRSLWLE